MTKQYYVKTLSADNNSCCMYFPRSLKQMGYEIGKHIKLTVNDDQTSISKIIDGNNTL